MLTARCHQRAAWRYRRELGAEVWLPVDASAADEEPDRRYGEGDTLPGGLVAVRTPGPEWPHYSFLRSAEPGVLFCSDLIAHEGGGVLRFIPPEYHEDPAETRRSVERLLELPFSILCFDHGAPPARRSPGGAAAVARVARVLRSLRNGTGGENLVVGPARARRRSVGPSRGGRSSRGRSRLRVKESRRTH